MGFHLLFLSLFAVTSLQALAKGEPDFASPGPAHEASSESPTLDRNDPICKVYEAQKQRKLKETFNSHAHANLLRAFNALALHKDFLPINDIAPRALNHGHEMTRKFHFPFFKDHARRMLAKIGISEDKIITDSKNARLLIQLDKSGIYAELGFDEHSHKFDLYIGNNPGTKTPIPPGVGLVIHPDNQITVEIDKKRNLPLQTIEDPTSLPSFCTTN